jgi:hypothetical protein
VDGPQERARRLDDQDFLGETVILEPPPEMNSRLDREDTVTLDFDAVASDRFRIDILHELLDKATPLL